MKEKLIRGKARPPISLSTSLGHVIWEDLLKKWLGSKYLDASEYPLVPGVTWIQEDESSYTTLQDIINRGGKEWAL